MGNNSSTVKNIVQDKINEVKKLTLAVSQIESSMRAELRESAAALEFYKKTFYQQQKQAEEYKFLYEDVSSKVNNVSEQLSKKIEMLHQIHNPDNDKLVAALKLVESSLKSKFTSIEKIQGQSKKHVAMMMEMKKRWEEMHARQQQNAKTIQNAWKAFKQIHRFRPTRTYDSDSESDSSIYSSSSDYSDGDIKQLNLYGGGGTESTIASLTRKIEELEEYCEFLEETNLFKDGVGGRRR